MRLRSQILAWITLTALVPLGILVIVAINSSERLHQQNLEQEVGTQLQTLVSELNRRLEVELEILKRLAETSPVEDYRSVLAKAAQGERHRDFLMRSGQVARHLRDFQSTVISPGTIRILDREAHTLVLVRDGRSSPQVYETLASYPLAEHEVDEPALRENLEQVAGLEAGALLLPQTRVERREGIRTPAVLDFVVPLRGGDETLGYLVGNVHGALLDRILDFAPRPYGGELLVAEVNREIPERDGLILYDDRAGRKFTSLYTPDQALADLHGGALAEAVKHSSYGKLVDPDTGEKVYYQEFMPYPHQLTTWVVAARIQPGETAAPFHQLRRNVLILAGLALLLGLVIAQGAARSVARPVVELAEALTRYGRGDTSVRVQPKGPDEVRTLRDSFNHMAEASDQARAQRDEAQRLMLHNARLASLGEMAAGIGHEINNPLNNILGVTRLLERNLPGDAEAAHQDVQMLRREVERASTIVQGVLNFARQTPPTVSRFDCRELVSETVELLDSAAARQGVRLTLHTADESGEIEGDRGQLQQVLVNLLLNAVQASSREQEVVVEMTGDEAGVTLRILDRGDGISAELGDQIWDPFVTTKPVGEGSGLGLSIAYGLVQAHNGRLELKNRPSGGAEARLWLPRVSNRGEAHNG